MESLKGHFLLAAPGLEDGSFYRSVVLMLSHDPEGALGVVLNRPTGRKFADLWSKFTGQPCDSPVLIHHGGPVQGPPILLHGDDSLDATRIVDGVFLSTDEEQVNTLITSPPEPLRLFCGYAGWGPGQLDHEMQSGGWLRTEAVAKHVFSDNDELWKTIAAEIGSPVLGDHYGEDDQAVDPTLN